MELAGNAHAAEGVGGAWGNGVPARQRSFAGRSARTELKVLQEVGRRVVWVAPRHGGTDGANGRSLRVASMMLSQVSEQVGSR